MLIPPTSLPAVFTAMGDTEYSHNSDGSHETGDSGRYSHDSREEMEMLHLSSVTCDPPTFLGSSVQGETASIPVQPTSGEDQRVLVVSHSTTSDLLALPRPSHMSSKPTSENTSNQFPI